MRAVAPGARSAALTVPALGSVALRSRAGVTSAPARPRGAQRLVVKRSTPVESAESAVADDDAHPGSEDQTHHRLREELDEVKLVLDTLRQEADRAALRASDQLEKREAAARSAREAEALKAVEQARTESRSKVRELDERLAAVARSSDNALRELRQTLHADGKEAMRLATARAAAEARSASARAAALQSQLELLTGIAERLTSNLEAKAEADTQLAALTSSFAALTAESVLLKDALAKAEARAAAAEARGAAAERSIAERVKETLTSASAIVEAAEAVRTETEVRAAAQAEVHAQMLAAAMARADAAEAELARRPLLLDTLGSKCAELEAARGELSNARLQLEALTAECGALRLARQEAQEHAAQAAAHASVLEKDAKAETQRLVAATQERTEAQLHMERVRAERAEAQLSSCMAELAAARAGAEDAQHQLGVLQSAADREREAHLNALVILERSREAWKAQALAHEADALAGRPVEHHAAQRGRLRKAMTGTELRALMASGPRVPERARWSGELADAAVVPPAADEQAVGDS